MDVGFKVIAALLLILASVGAAIAMPISVCAVEYGMSTCPHCLHLKETLTQMGIPLTFVDVNENRTDTEEYMSLYSALVGGTYYVPFTIFIVNGTAKLALVGDRDAAELLRLLRSTVNATGLLLSTARGDETWITDSRLVEALNETVTRRAPPPVVILLPGAELRGEAKLLTPFGTPLASADVLVACPGGVQYRGTSDSLGRVQLACGEANITVLFWMGLPINRTVSARLGSSVTVGGVGRLTIRVQDLLNRPLPQASVSLIRGRVELVGETGSDGSITADLPAGSYALSASKAGKSSTIEARVVEGEAAEVALTLDIILTIGGYGIGLRELPVAVGAAAIIVVAAILLRRRAKAVKTASEGGSEG